MKYHFLITIALATSVLFFSGCDRSRTSDYPDSSADTVRRTDDIKQNGRDQRQAVDNENARANTRMDFNEQQIRDRYAGRRQSHVNEANAETTVSDAKVREILIQAKHDKDVIDAQVVADLRTSPNQNAAEIRADATRRKSEIDNRASVKIAPIHNDSNSKKSLHVQRGIEIDREEAQELSVLARERSQANNQARGKKLEIDQWQNEEMSRVERDSNPRNR
ncbi:MAG: hypothetical protein EA402_14555 [Planctomycetota bacterium]|nr:MAG: hypothetical protein EA402_14555 [Planctomycetota bacterium]